MPKGKFEIIRKCQICGAEFAAKTIESIYCSKACSNKAYRQRQAQLREEKKLDEIVTKIDNRYDLIKVSEAHALFGVCTVTIYRLIRKGIISHVNLGEKQIRVKKSELMNIYPLRKSIKETAKPIAKMYSMEPQDCYTIGQVTEIYKVSEKTVYKHIRQYGIPIRQIGKYVYTPKSEIDNLYK